jgi:hypothetical protein
VQEQEKEKGSDELLGQEALQATRREADRRVAEQVEEDRLADAAEAVDDEDG